LSGFQINFLKTFSSEKFIQGFFSKEFWEASEKLGEALMSLLTTLKLSSFGASDKLLR